MPVTWALDAPWRTASPDDAAAKGPWWLHYNDPTLAALQGQALAANATLAIANVRHGDARITALRGTAPAARRVRP